MSYQGQGATATHVSHQSYPNPNPLASGGYQIQSAGPPEVGGFYPSADPPPPQPLLGGGGGGYHYPQAQGPPHAGRHGYNYGSYDYGSPYDHRSGCPPFLRTCLAALCCCCVLEECCIW